MALYVPRPLEPGWEALLVRAFGRVVQKGALGIMVERLSRRYNGEDVALAHGDELAARALFWLPRDIHKVALPLAELAAVGALPARPLRVLDLGAGLGASTLGLLRTLADPALPRALAGAAAATPPDARPTVAHVTAVDRDAQALDLFRRIATEATRAGLLPTPLPELDMRQGDLTAPESFLVAGEPPYDLVLIGTALVEVTRGAAAGADEDEVDHDHDHDHGDADRPAATEQGRAADEAARGARIAAHLARLCEGPAPVLAPDGALIVIEPATRPETRALHTARGELFARGLGVFAPCTHAGPCPMLARTRDWCHEDLDVDLPAWLVDIARAAGLRWQGLTFSYLTVRRDGTRSVAELLTRAQYESGAFVPARLVSSPRETKGKAEAFASASVPDGSGGARLMQLERDARAARKGGGARPVTLLADLARGDVIGLDPSALARAEPGRPVRVAPAEIVAPRHGETPARTSADDDE